MRYNLTGSYPSILLLPGVVLAVGEDLLHIFLRPFCELPDEGEERLSEFGKAVFDSRGDFGVCLAVDEAVGLEGAQGGGEYSRRHVGNEAAEFVEPHDALLADDKHGQERPFVAESGYDVSDRAHLYDGTGILFLPHISGYLLLFAKLVNFFFLTISKTEKKVTMGEKCKFLTDKSYCRNFAVPNKKLHTT